MMSMNTQERIAACSLVPKRFPGRAKLELAAAHPAGGLELIKLERKLGLLSDDEVLDTRLAWMLSEASGYYYYDNKGVLPALVGLALAPDNCARRRQIRRDFARGVPHLATLLTLAPEVCDAVMDLRELREEQKAVTDPLALRRPLHIQRKMLEREARLVIRAAGFRTAKWRHKSAFLFVPEGRESVWSTTDDVRPSEVGASAAYCKQVYWVTTSKHAWHVSLALLSPEVKALNSKWAPKGRVYLRTDLRVVQAKGTTLKIQRRGPRGGWA